MSIACLYSLVSTAVAIAQDISAGLQSGEIPLDATRISAEISKQSAGSDSRLANISTYLLLFCWLAGIVDSYREGRLEDRRGKSRDAEK